jgi:hypothetical protein
LCPANINVPHVCGKLTITPFSSHFRSTPFSLSFRLSLKPQSGLERFEDFLLRLHDAYSSPNPNISRFTRAIERNADHD